ncbi:nuclear transport factor 2 family protein [candidate division WOR-3 bacterium]|nr:nuclear transport factor 2 family protein [candidate division WOR-3 bacterium]
MTGTPEEVVREFVRRINAQEVQGIIDMLTSDHVFIDACGDTSSYHALKTGWSAYFRLDPEYVIEPDEVIVSGNTVVILGRSKGCYVVDGKRRPPYDQPTVWKAVVRDGKLSLWQVYSYGPQSKKE